MFSASSRIFQPSAPYVAAHKDSQQQVLSAKSPHTELRILFNSTFPAFHWTFFCRRPQPIIKAPPIAEIRLRGVAPETPLRSENPSRPKSSESLKSQFLSQQTLALFRCELIAARLIPQSICANNLKSGWRWNRPSKNIRHVIKWRFKNKAQLSIRFICKGALLGWTIIILTKRIDF